MALTEYRYLFAIGTIFSLLDAYNIGANDVANSWATSVSSKSLTMRQAVLGAAVFEFLGAVTVGARTADTIKNGIIVSQPFLRSPYHTTIARLTRHAMIRSPLKPSRATQASRSWLSLAPLPSLPPGSCSART